MAGNEVRVHAEGALRWIQASGTGGGVGGWATASAAATALVGFVQADFAFASAQNVVTVKNRGVPDHHKIIGREAVDVTFTYLQAVTGNMANPATASGASVPKVHFELLYDVAELPDPTAQYFQFNHAVLVDRGFSEGEEGNQYSETWRALFMVGPTGSGYIA